MKRKNKSRNQVSRKFKQKKMKEYEREECIKEAIYEIYNIAATDRDAFNRIFDFTNHMQRCIDESHKHFKKDYFKLNKDDKMRIFAIATDLVKITGSEWASE